MRTGRIYGQAGDGSWLFTFKTEAQAIAETASPRNGETADCVYDGRVKSADGQSSARAQNGWVRWGAPETAEEEALYGSWAVVVSVGWLCLGCAWCGLGRLERNYECSSSGEKWGEVGGRSDLLRRAALIGAGDSDAGPRGGECN